MHFPSAPLATRAKPNNCISGTQKTGTTRSVRGGGKQRTRAQKHTYTYKKSHTHTHNCTYARAERTMQLRANFINISAEHLHVPFAAVTESAGRGHRCAARSL
jgi:hypothetical protein